MNNLENTFEIENIKTLENNLIKVGKVIDVKCFKIDINKSYTFDNLKYLFYYDENSKINIKEFLGINICDKYLSCNEFYNNLFKPCKNCQTKFGNNIPVIHTFLACPFEKYNN